MFYPCMRAGVTAALLNTNLKDHPLAHCVQAANAATVIVGSIG